MGQGRSEAAFVHRPGMLSGHSEEGQPASHQGDMDRERPGHKVWGWRQQGRCEGRRPSKDEEPEGGESKGQRKAEEPQKVEEPEHEAQGPKWRKEERGRVKWGGHAIRGVWPGGRDRRRPW